MRRTCWFMLLIVSNCWPFTLSGMADPADLTPNFEGVWSGEITAPDRHAVFGIGFTRAGEDLLVSVYFPEMYLYSVNFGPAEIHDGLFVLPALNLSLRRTGESLTGSFATGKIPVTLQRGGVFESAPNIPQEPPPPPLAWSSALGSSVWASPTQREGVIYVGTVDGKMHALRANDGAPQWTWVGPNALYGEALATDDGLYFVDDGGDLVCLARASGELRWRRPLHETSKVVTTRTDDTFNHRVATPVIDPQGVLYVGSNDGGIYAVKARTGKTLWRYDPKTKICAPVVLRGEELILAGIDGTVVVLNRRTHLETARRQFPGAVVSAPVVSGDRLIMGCRDYYFRGLDRTTLKTVWEDSFWFSWIESAPRLANGVLYVGSSDYRRVSAVNATDGRTLWRTDVQGLSWGTPVLAGDAVYAGTLGQMIAGTVIQHRGGLVALDRATGRVKWRYDVPVEKPADFVGFAGSLVATESTLVGAQMDGLLVAFPLGSPSSAPSSPPNRSLRTEIKK